MLHLFIYFTYLDKHSDICITSLSPQELFEPQTGLLRYVLEQPYSREMVCNMLGLNKQVRFCVLCVGVGFFTCHSL